MVREGQERNVKERKSDESQENTVTLVPGGKKILSQIPYSSRRKRTESTERRLFRPEADADGRKKRSVLDWSGGEAARRREISRSAGSHVREIRVGVVVVGRGCVRNVV